MDILKKLAQDWRNKARMETMRIGVSNALLSCADELEALTRAVEQLGKFIPGNGVGLPHGTIAWVVHDSKRYIREWHPLAPDAAGKPLGNWWALDGSSDVTAMFCEHEVTHYSIIEVPQLSPSDAAVVEPAQGSR